MNIINNYTVKELWSEAMSQVKQDPIWLEDCGMLDYVLGEDESTPFTSYEFNNYATTEFGGSEGIYSHIMLDGRFFDYQKSSRYRIGVLKTLGCSKEDYLKMARLSTLIAYYIHKIVNENINRFESDERASVTLTYNDKFGSVTLKSILNRKPVIRVYGKEEPLPVTPEIMRRLLEDAFRYYGNSLTEEAMRAFQALSEKTGYKG